MRGLFVTGTDTGVGKTEVTAAITRTWRRQGRDFFVCKPVATGLEQGPNGWHSPDTDRLAAAAGLLPEAVTPGRMRFREPAAPPVAAIREGVELRLATFVEELEGLAGPGRRVGLIEGVGGLLCPLTRGETVADLIGRLGMPTLVVARRSLGTLNHTLLTVEVALRRGLRVAGVVINATTPVRGLAEEVAAEELRERLPVPVLAEVPWRGARADEEIPSLAAVDWWSLVQ